MKKILTNIIALVLAMMMCSVNAFAGDYASGVELSMVKVGEFNSHTYAIYYGTIAWDEAKAWCENSGGHLVTITSGEEQSFIESFNSDYDYLWIGAYRERIIDWEWKWVTGEKWDYTNWAEGEPNNSPNVVPDENCVVLWPMEWNDLNGNNIIEQCGFICEWDNGSVENPTEKPTEEPTEKPTEKPTEESYYFDIHIEGGVQLKEGEMYEIFIDTNSPLENPFKLKSTDEKVFVVSGNCIIATGEGEAELLIADNYEGMMYSYSVYVEASGGDIEEPTEKPTEEPTEKPTEKPTEEPTEKPTEKPTEEPTEKPTEEKTEDEGEVSNGVGKYQSHSYAIYYCSITWEEARRWCENNGGHLATITTRSEQSFVESLNGSRDELWIGAYREQKTDWVWKWVTGEKWDYTNWAEGEPNNSPNVVPDENCVVLWPMEWNDLNGNNIIEQCGFICEWEYINDNIPEKGSGDTEPPADEDTSEKPADEPYYFDVCIQGDITLKAGERYEIFVDTNSPLENPFKLQSTDARVLEVSGNCIVAMGEGEAMLLIADSYSGVMYSYAVCVAASEDGSDEEVEPKPERVVEMEITTTLKESTDTEEEAEVTVHIELTEVTDGNVEDSKVFIRATGADGAQSIQSLDGSESIDVDVPVSKRQVKVFCFESMTTLKPLCEAQIIEIEY